MVLLGLGVLLVSLSVLLYNYKTPTRSGAFLSWTCKGQSEKGSAGSPAKGNGANAVRAGDSIPTFTLDDGGNETVQMASRPEQRNSVARDLKAEPAAQTQPVADSVPPLMPPPARPSSNAKQGPEQIPTPLMPPPSRPMSGNPTFKMPPKPSTALRPPPSAATTLRAPPSSSLKPFSSSLGPSISTLAPSNRPSKKVILDPGHSPLDWAHLTANPPTPTFLRGADVPLNLIRVPPSALRYHSGRKGKDAWGVYQGKVYNLSPYMKFHPGGVAQLMKGAGKEKEGEKLFNEVHPWVSWENMLGECLIGILVSENEVQANGAAAGENELEEMD